MGEPRHTGPMRPVPPACVELLARFEGFSPTAIDDVGRKSIGYGHDIFRPDDPLLTKTISKAEGLALAAADLKDTARRLEGAMGDHIVAKLTDGQWAAVIDLAYNIGIGRFEGSTLYAKIHAGDFAGVPQEFDRWAYAKVDGIETKLDGLVKRRAAERALWEGKV